MANSDTYTTRAPSPAGNLVGDLQEEEEEEEGLFPMDPLTYHLTPDSLLPMTCRGGAATSSFPSTTAHSG